MPSLNAHTSLTFGSFAQSLEFYPPAEEVAQDGPPASAATYRIFRGEQSNDDPPLFAGTATLDAVSTTTDGGSGPSQVRRNRIALTSTAGVVLRRRYLIENVSASGGQRSIVTVGSVQSGDSVDADYDLQYEFATGSAFKGLRHSFVVDSTFTNTSSNINLLGSRVLMSPSAALDSDVSAPPYRVEWAYTTAGGITRRHWTTFDLCRAPLKHNVTVEHVRQLMPDVVWQEWAGQRGQDFGPQIAASFDRVRMDIRAAGYDPDSVSDPEVIDHLVKLAAAALLAAEGCHPSNRNPDLYADEREKLYQKALGALVHVTLKAWLAVDSTGATAANVAESLSLQR